MSGGLSLAQRPSLDEPARSARCSHPRPSDAAPSKLDPKAPAGNPYYDLEVSPATEVALAGMRPVDRAQEQKWGTQRGDTEAGLDRRAPSPYSESAEVHNREGGEATWVTRRGLPALELAAPATGGC